MTERERVIADLDEIGRVFEGLAAMHRREEQIRRDRVKAMTGEHYVDPVPEPVSDLFMAYARRTAAAAALLRRVPEVANVGVSESPTTEPQTCDELSKLAFS